MKTVTLLLIITTITPQASFTDNVEETDRNYFHPFKMLNFKTFSFTTKTRIIRKSCCLLLLLSFRFWFLVRCILNCTTEGRNSLLKRADLGWLKWTRSSVTLMIAHFACTVEINIEQWTQLMQQSLMSLLPFSRSVISNLGSLIAELNHWLTSWISSL